MTIAPRAWDCALITATCRRGSKSASIRGSAQKNDMSVIASYWANPGIDAHDRGDVT